MMGTATNSKNINKQAFRVGAYSMNDGDCDTLFELLLSFTQVGAYSMNDGDCDVRHTPSTVRKTGRSVFHE